MRCPDHGASFKNSIIYFLFKFNQVHGVVHISNIFTSYQSFPPLGGKFSQLLLLILLFSLFNADFLIITFCLPCWFKFLVAEVNKKILNFFFSEQIFFAEILQFSEKYYISVKINFVNKYYKFRENITFFGKIIILGMIFVVY